MKIIHKMIIVSKDNKDIVLNTFKFTQIKYDNYYIYQCDCHIPYNDYIFLVNQQLNMFIGINNDDKHYNHCYELCLDPSLLAKYYEKSYSVYIGYNEAITLYIIKIEPN
jgi:hypothetical protein